MSSIQIVTLASLSGDGLSFFNRYPMKAFANSILADPNTKKKIGLYQLGSHRARMGVLTGLPSIYLHNPKELKQFVQSEKNIYVVMRQADWQKDFSDLPIIKKATDSGWKKSKNFKDTIGPIVKNGIKPYMSEYSENYILLKTEGRE